MEPLDLHAPGLLLRPWTAADLDDVWSALQDPEIALWNGQGAVSREETAAMLARRVDWSDGAHASFAVVDPDGGRLLGSVSLYSIDRVHSVAEIGYWITAPARRRGTAAVEVDAVCRWALTDLGPDCIALFHARPRGWASGPAHA